MVLCDNLKAEKTFFGYQSRLMLAHVRYMIFIFRLLRGLAIFDALFLFAAILSFGLPTLSQWFNDEIFMRIMATLFGLLHTFRTGSVYVTLAVTFERFYSIVCPFRHNR